MAKDQGVVITMSGTMKIPRCCATDLKTKVRCENDATVMLVGFDHNHVRITDNLIEHREYIVAGEYPTCNTCIASLQGWIMFRHYKMETVAIDDYTPVLVVEE